MTPSKPSKYLEKLMESADISFEDGKHYVKSAYEQAIKEGSVRRRQINYYMKKHVL